MAKDKKEDIQELILEGAKLSEIKKKAEKDLEVIKSKLKKFNLKTGVNIGNDNSVLTISERSVWKDLYEPKEFFEELKKKRKSSLFWKCISIQTKLAVEALGEDEFRTYQTKGDPQKSFSFSK